MNKTCIINISFSIHENLRVGLHPSPTKTGKAIKIITGASEEECMNILKQFFEKNGISVLEKR